MSQGPKSVEGYTAGQVNHYPQIGEYKKAYQIVSANQAQVDVALAEIEKLERGKQMVAVNWLVAGICIVGSMVAIAATGGVATPFVVGLISGVSTAVITGTQEATAQYVEKGDWSEVDWLAVAGKTALGFASGFVTGWLGTHAGNFLTGFLTKGALPFRQSGSKVVRVTSYSVINGTVESGSGILTRFSGEAIVTNGDWKKA